MHTSGESRKKRGRDSEDIVNQASKNDSHTCKQNFIDKLISEYVIEDVLPLSTVESPDFRKLMGGISSAQVPDRKSFTLRLDKAFDEIEKEVKATLEGIDSVSTMDHNYSFFWNDGALD